MQTFLLVWLGQVVSLLGSKLTEFALGVWAYQQTGSMTQFALIVLFIYLPNVIISPLAGAIIDRWNRRWILIATDTIAGIATLGFIGLVSWGQLQIWHIYLGVSLLSLLNGFQVPAYTAAIAQLVPSQQYGRANGMVQASKAIAKIISPLLAGFLMTVISLKGVLLVDFSTFLVAFLTLISVRFPPVKTRKTRSIEPRRLQREIVLAWRYLVSRSGLFQFLLFTSVTYFSLGMLEVLLWSFILNFGSSTELGFILSIGGCGMLLGSLLSSVWSGPKYRMTTILGFVAVQGIFVILCGLFASVSMTTIGVFGYLFAQPIIISSNQAIWQRKIPLNLQGRIFALQQMLERGLSIFAYILVGPLVDYVFEPFMAKNGLLANSLGRIMGTGEGRGTALLWIVIGLLNLTAAYVAYRQPRIRYLEQEMPDFSASSPSQELLVNR